jgi:deoxyribodipyrimidine photolyase
MLSKSIQKGAACFYFRYRHTQHSLNDKKDKRVNFIYKELKKIKLELEKSGSTLMVFYGKPLDVFQKLDV